MNPSGAEAEQAALHYLQQRGLKLLERNYRCRYGEIDLVCQDQQTLVFVEVRLRQNPRFGGAGSSITGSKQAKLIRAAQHYLGARGNIPPCRFDVVLLNSMLPGGIEWIQDAFSQQ